VNRIRVADPGVAFGASRAQLIRAFELVLDSGSYILAAHVEEFERTWAARCEAPWAVGVSSGTDALALALRAVGVGPGDEVLVPAMTATATWMAVSQIGAVPVGVDIELERNAIDPRAAAAAVTNRTRALVAVHLFGQPADMDALSVVAREAGIALVEDAAQAHGARYRGRSIGSLAGAAAFSFYPTKNLGALGDAGAVTTADAEVAERVRMLRQYGWRNREDTELQGVNARLDELQAALLLVMVETLDRQLTQRRELAELYLRGLADISELELPSPIEGDEHAWHQFVIRHPRRDALAARLEQAGIGTAVHYRAVPPLLGAFDEAGARAGAFPHAERHAATALSLPLHPGLETSDAHVVIDALADAASRV
jgi:dTDP-4-amino-4,6-dideoxygalactose transaminase